MTPATESTYAPPVKAGDPHPENIDGLWIFQEWLMGQWRVVLPQEGLAYHHKRTLLDEIDMDCFRILKL